MRLPADWVEIIWLSIAKSLIDSTRLLENTSQFVMKQKHLSFFLKLAHKQHATR